MTRHLLAAFLASVAITATVACSSSDDDDGGTIAGDGGGPSDGGGSSGDGGGEPVGPPDPVCEPLLDAIDMTGAAVVGTGSAASCTEEALKSAIASSSKVTFDCGGEATITITSTIELPIDRDTTVDGGGEITLDGEGATTRIFSFDSPNFRATDHTVTLQGLTLANATAPADDFTAQDTGSPECAWGYKDGMGGAVFVRDGRLHILDCLFQGNAAAPTGPDTGGGAIFALGSLEVLIQGSEFRGNSGSNGGAIGILQSDLRVTDSRFANNAATGEGANFGGATGCPDFNHAEQGGAGGNGAAIAIDGNSVTVSDFCGVVFEDNTGGALGTLFRTPNRQREAMLLDRCTFDGNTTNGGGALYTQDMDVTIRASAFVGNTASGNGGAVRVEQGPHGSTLNIENTTFDGNRSIKALGGAVVFRGEALLKNVTFSRNEAVGGFEMVDGEGRAYFGAAISGGHGGGGRFEVYNSVFWNNKDTHPYTAMTCNVGDGTLDGANNLQWPEKRIDEDGTPHSNDDNPCVEGITFADADLGDLTDGSRAPGAAALGAGSDCPATDQRGNDRPGDGCDLGAVEAE